MEQKISKKVIKKINRYYIKSKIFTIESQKYVFVLGKDKDKDNVIVDMTKVSTNGGCSWLPRIPSEEMHKAYIKLVKQGLIPCGLVYICRNTHIYSSYKITQDAAWLSWGNGSIVSTGEIVLVRNSAGLSGSCITNIGWKRANMISLKEVEC